MRLLLGHQDIDFNTPDNDGRRPISWAAQHGHEAVVKLLLGPEDVDPDRPDEYGQTPISPAAKSGQEGATRLLLDREDINPDMLEAPAERQSRGLLGKLRRRWR